jgi:hypothetical protein
MKRLLAALLCVMMVLVLFPVSALAAEGTAAPDSGNYFETPFRAKVLPNGYIGALYLMNQPEVGHGHTGTVSVGSRVFVLGEQNGFFFVVTNNGQKGWVWNEWFDYDKNVVSLEKAESAEDAALYPTVSTKGAELVFPDEDAYAESAEGATVKTQWKCGSIFLMPQPEAGHGNLGTVACGEDVEILAEQDGFCFFRTADGRYGWNSPDWFE